MTGPDESPEFETRPSVSQEEVQSRLGIHLIADSEDFSVRLEYPDKKPREVQEIELDDGERVEFNPRQNQIVVFNAASRPPNDHEFSLVTEDEELHRVLRRPDVVLAFDRENVLRRLRIWGSSPDQILFTVESRNKILRVEKTIAITRTMHEDRRDRRLTRLAVAAEYDSLGRRLKLEYLVYPGEEEIFRTRDHAGRVTFNETTALLEEPLLERRPRDEEKTTDTELKLARADIDYRRLVHAQLRVAARMQASLDGYHGLPATIDPRATITELAELPLAAPLMRVPVPNETGVGRVAGAVHDNPSGVRLVDIMLVPEKERQDLGDLRHRLLEAMRDYPEFFRSLNEEWARAYKQAREKWSKCAAMGAVPEHLYSGIKTQVQAMWLSGAELLALDAALVGTYLGDLAKQRRDYQISLEEDGRADEARKTAGEAHSLGKAAEVWEDYLEKTRWLRLGQGLLYGMTDLDLNINFTVGEFQAEAGKILHQLRDWKEKNKVLPDHDWHDQCQAWQEWLVALDERELADHLGGPLGAINSEGLRRLKADPDYVPAYRLATGLFDWIEESWGLELTQVEGRWTVIKKNGAGWRTFRHSHGGLG
jgi:hypothetical protein